MPSIVLSLIFSFFSLWSFPSIAHADESVPATPVKLALQTYSIDNKSYIAISFENYPQWHTYWKNPGDAGLAIKNQFSIGKDKKEIKLTEEEWPAPRRFIENGTQWAYGYVGNYTLFYRLEKNDLTKLSGKNLVLNSSWLVCKHICVPGQKEISFKLNKGAITT
ncbi:MAG: protein-disulfide reductase DsbD domain-containing protein, partial [Bacteriovorax sp.]